MDLSIITVTFRDIEGLKATCKSVKEQKISSHAVEWIVVDGNSNDGTKEFLKSNTSVFENNIKFEYKSESDKGIYDAMNKGIDLAKGKFVLFLNGGDIFFDEKVVQEFLEQVRKAGTEKAVFYGNFLINFRERLSVKRNAREISYMKHSLPTSHQAILYPKSYTKKYKYDLEYKITGDYFFTAQAYKLGYQFIKLDLFISIFESGGTSILNINLLLKEAARVQKEVLGLGSIYIAYSYVKRFLALILNFTIDVFAKKVSKSK